MFFAPAQRFPVIAEYFDGELIAFRSRDRDRAIAFFPFDRDLKTYRSIDRSIRDRISFNEIPVLHRNKRYRRATLTTDDARRSVFSLFFAVRQALTWPTIYDSKNHIY